MININQFKIEIVTRQNAITSEQFRGAFISYIREQFTPDEQNKLPMDLAFNKDKNAKLLNRYAFMQYATRKNTLEIVSIKNSDKIVELWLEKVLKNQNFSINGKSVKLTDIQRKTNYWQPQLSKPQLYKIENWIPFRSDNLGDETKFDRIIWGNIHRLLTDLEIEFDEKPFIHILEYKRNKRMIKGYDIKWISYQLILSTNINLPENLGIGHIVSLGNGKIKKLKLL